MRREGGKGREEGGRKEERESNTAPRCSLQAVRRMAATAEIQHSFREACMRYVGVARDQG